jgi:transposase
MGATSLIRWHQPSHGGKLFSNILDEAMRAGGFDADEVAADIVQEQEARIAALERLVGKLALENEFLKGASRSAARQRSETTSVVAGPVVSRSPKDAG